MIITPAALFRCMLRIRRVEEALAARYPEQQMRCPMHLCIGQEAISTGVCLALDKHDVVFSNHRAHGHYLAKGGDLAAMVAEIYGRATGCCGGRGGSMHLIDQAVGFLGATPIVGGTVPLAVGAAWTSTLKGTGSVAVTFFGDGCFEEGVVHESLNFAALHKLPVIFVCENNDMSVYTRLSERQPSRPIHKVAEAHGLAAAHVDGNAVEEVLAISQRAVANARQGEGPQFIELSTYRWREHCGPHYDYDLNYRTRDEITTGLSTCPIKNYEAAAGLGEGTDARVELERELNLEICAAFEAALAGPEPDPRMAAEKVYA